MIERVTELELAVSHLQNDYDALNEVVVENGERLRSLDLALKRLVERLDSLVDAKQEGDPKDEKPPHY